MPPIPKRKKKMEVKLVPIGDEGVAINVFDLDNVDPALRKSLLSGNLILSDTIWVDRNRTDEVGIVFRCPVTEAAKICDIIRGLDRKAGRTPTRTYLRRSRTWSKIPHNVPLSITDVKTGEVFLSPRLFRIEVVGDAPEAQRIEGGEDLL